MPITETSCFLESENAIEHILSEDTFDRESSTSLCPSALKLLHLIEMFKYQHSYLLNSTKWGAELWPLVAAQIVACGGTG